MEVQFVQPRSDVSISSPAAAGIHYKYWQSGLWLIHASENCIVISVVVHVHL
jgi:hypothetical protein